jgi:hypothetical protein
VLGAHERVRITGWSARPVAARAWAPSTGSMALDATYDAVSGQWDVAVDIPGHGWTRLQVRPQD